MARRKRLICTVHDEIWQTADEILELDLKDSNDRRKLKRLAKRIQNDASEAKIYGQSMENRLSDYKDAVENLGFKRKKN